MEKSMLDVAYEIVAKRTKPISFKELVDEVGKVLNLSETEIKSKIARFYTNLMLDGRFVTLGENTWDLRSRNKYEKVHIDMNDVYKEEDDEEDSDDEDENFGDDEIADDDIFGEPELKKNDIIIETDDMEGE